MCMARAPFGKPNKLRDHELRSKLEGQTQDAQSRSFPRRMILLALVSYLLAITTAGKLTVDAVGQDAFLSRDMVCVLSRI